MVFSTKWMCPIRKCHILGSHVLWGPHKMSWTKQKNQQFQCAMYLMDQLSVPFANLINTSLSRNVFPDIMKCAEVSPIFKKDDNLLKGNFRPVSILTSISKIYENVVNNQLLGHFYEIFNDLFSAFRKGHSCQLLLLKFVEDMKNALDQKHAVGALFMDLSKAFDCLPHGLLVAKLHAYGLTPAACCLLGDYLSGSRQRVKISDARSAWETLAKGVPQGSILGPLLFNIFINDMFYFMEKCSLYNYADDNSLSNSASSVDEVLSNWHLCIPDGLSVVQCSHGHVIGIAFFGAISVAWSVRAGQLAAGGVASVWRSWVRSPPGPR